MDPTNRFPFWTVLSSIRSDNASHAKGASMSVAYSAAAWLTCCSIRQSIPSFSPQPLSADSFVENPDVLPVADPSPRISVLITRLVRRTRPRTGKQPLPAREATFFFPFLVEKSPGRRSCVERLVRQQRTTSGPSLNPYPSTVEISILCVSSLGKRVSSTDRRLLHLKPGI